MKIGYNEGCAIKKSNLEMDLRFAEKYHYDYIEINLDKLKEYLETHTLNNLKQFFQKNHLVKVGSRLMSCPELVFSKSSNLLYLLSLHKLDKIKKDEKNGIRKKERYHKTRGCI